jgi:DNA-binding NarL/FixJ family response regulator
LLARGVTVKRAAVLLGIGEHTVKEHSMAARRALGARNTAQAVGIALSEGLIVP